MKEYRPYLSVFVLMAVTLYFALFLFADTVSAKEARNPAISKSEALSKVSKLHIPFIPNQGQEDKIVKFYANTFCGKVFVTETGEIIYSLPKMERGEKTPRQVKALKGWVLKEELVGGSIKEVKTEEKAITRVSYFIGSDSSRWRSDIPTYGIVSLGEVYEGINVKLRAYGRSVEKLFYIKAGIDPGSIRLSLRGGESFRVNQEGELEVKTSIGDVKFSKPVAYQEINNRRVDVAVNYDFSNSELSTTNSELTYGFKVGDYDSTRDLIIDPLLQSTYLGGNSSDVANSIVIGSSGNAYVAGYTYSIDFPGAAGGAQPSLSGGDAFVSKFNSDLTTLLQSTYLGGSGSDWANSMTIDSGGNVYVVGETFSTDFPGTAGGAQPSFGGGSKAFVTKLNSGLTAILQSTYLGGNGYEEARSISIDLSGNVYVAGRTNSPDFPGTAGGAQPSMSGGGDAFVAKLNSGLTAILQSTYLGGGSIDEAYSIALFDGNIYVTGYTGSADFPGTTGGAQPSFGGGLNDAFISKLNSNLTILLQSTYLGGNNNDEAKSIVINSSGNVYVAGFTTSANFPGTVGGAQPSGSGWDAFITKLNPNLTSILQSTYLGGSRSWASSIAIDSGGNVYVAGFTESTNFPGSQGGAQESYGGGADDAFVSKLNSNLTAILQSTYLGGNAGELADSITISEGNVYVAGHTDSTNFPRTSGGAQTSFGGTYDAFVAKFTSDLTATLDTVNLISPSGTITTVTPTYIWNAVLGAMGYYLWVNDSTGNKIKQGYTPSAAGCPDGTGTCSVTPSAALAAGTGTWWVLTFGYGEVGPWSAGVSFTVSPPGQATLVSPSGTITDTTPTYMWNAAFGSTWYHLWVNDSTGNKIQQWYTADACGCVSGIGTCSVTPTTEVIGSSQWWIQTYNSAGFGPWSAPLSFSTPIPTVPVAATLVSPSMAINDTTPTYTWYAVSNATWYQLYVNDSTGNKIQQWYRAADLDCPDIPDVMAACSVTPTMEVRGAGHWWVQTYNSGGFGPWSLPGMSFTAPTPSAPSAATQISPSGAINDITPTYTWYAVSNATWYQLWVGDSSGNKINQWYAAADAGCADGVGGVDTCSVTPTTEVVGSCLWYIRPYNSGGLGSWSIPGMSFTVSPPPASTLVSPSGTITDTTPSYIWNAVLGATWYQLYVNDSTGKKIQKWYTASEAGCPSGTGTCSVTPTPFLIGTGDWKIQTYNSAGYGLWSSSLSFSVPSLSGGWSGILISISEPYEPDLLECAINQNGNNLSGTIAVDQFFGNTDFSGTISGNSAHLTFSFLYLGYYVTAALNLTSTAFDGNSFSGNYALTLCIYGYCQTDSGTLFLAEQ